MSPLVTVMVYSLALGIPAFKPARTLAAPSPSGVATGLHCWLTIISDPDFPIYVTTISADGSPYREATFQKGFSILTCYYRSKVMLYGFVRDDTNTFMETSSAGTRPALFLRALDISQAPSDRNVGIPPQIAIQFSVQHSFDLGILTTFNNFASLEGRMRWMLRCNPLLQYSSKAQPGAGPTQLNIEVPSSTNMFFARLVGPQILGDPNVARAGAVLKKLIPYDMYDREQLRPTKRWVRAFIHQKAADNTLYISWQLAESAADFGWNVPPLSQQSMDQLRRRIARLRPPETGFTLNPDFDIKFKDPPRP
ncbi:MAG: hypothetical protein M1833_001911 [Piccolia ochrophora]|nr:MAG: hypothetical protein M1833_001911 [Piccolia ochrophora]